ncbi:MAG: hypothetical protein KBT22_03335 [Bacteroidales bacterium]|nr:hypothetical protein [Candidatus Scybalocola fimicaballi]
MIIETLSITAIVAALVFYFNRSKQTNKTGIKLDKITSTEKMEVETLDMSVVVSYFKDLLNKGELRKGKDTPFILTNDTFRQIVKEPMIDLAHQSLIMASYNEETEEVQNVTVVEYKTLGESLKKVFSQSKNGIVTLS